MDCGLVAFPLAVAAERRRATVSYVYLLQLSIDCFYCLMNVVFLIRSIIGNLKGFVIFILVVLKWLVDFWFKLYFCIEML